MPSITPMTVRFWFAHDSICCAIPIEALADSGRPGPPEAELLKRRARAGEDTPLRATPHSRGDGLPSTTRVDGASDAGRATRAARTIDAEKRELGEEGEEARVGEALAVLRAQSENADLHGGGQALPPVK